MWFLAFGGVGVRQIRCYQSFDWELKWQGGWAVGNQGGGFKLR